MQAWVHFIFIPFLLVYNLIPRVVDLSCFLSLQTFNPTGTSLHSWMKHFYITKIFHTNILPRKPTHVLLEYQPLDACHGSGGQYSQERLQTPPTQWKCIFSASLKILLPLLQPCSTQKWEGEKAIKGERIATIFFFQRHWSGGSWGGGDDLDWSLKF